MCCQSVQPGVIVGLQLQLEACGAPVTKKAYFILVWLGECDHSYCCGLCHHKPCLCPLQTRVLQCGLQPAAVYSRGIFVGSTWHKGFQVQSKALYVYLQIPLTVFLYATETALSFCDLAVSKLEPPWYRREEADGRLFSVRSRQPWNSLLAWAEMASSC